VIILGQLSKEYLCKISDFGFPLVFLDFYYDRFKTDSINTDNFMGTYEITNLLVEKGHTKIAFVGNLNLTSSIQDRYLGYYKAMLEYRLPIRNEWLISDRTDESKWIDIKLPENMPTAFVCNCDKTALILIKKLVQKGFRVPEDCSVAGFDDSVHAVNSLPQISTVRVNLDEMAKMSVRIIIKKINDESTVYGRVLIRGNIILRNSISEI